MASNFDDIWTFIEEKLNTQVPAYFKYILKYCGFSNGISIATIENDDILHFVQEVRNENVSNYFRPLIGNRNVLEGSTKTIENFEFSHGHLKFLKYIVNFLKNCLQENGLDCFSKEPPPNSNGRVKRQIQETVCSSRKRLRVDLNENLRNQEGFLLGKTIMSVITHASQIYVKHFKILNNKFAVANTVSVEIDKSSNENVPESGSIRYIGRIICPFCSQIINLSNTEQVSNSMNPSWDTTNLDVHIKTHQNYPNFEIEQQNYQHIGNVESSYTAISGMLQNFVDAAKRNFPRKKQGYRHDDIIKMFAAFLKMIAGLLAYETLHANFPLSLPSVSTVNRFITDNGPEIIEGEMRTDQLLNYLQSRNLPLVVSISEDATRITAKISYDPHTNQLVGFALPLDVNGMPIKFSFPARNVREIQNHFSNTSNFISSTVYVQMAQPLDENVPPFCLMLYLTDSTFTGCNTLKRWKFQAANLKEKGIRIENFATDGDSRPLLVMKCLSRIGIPNRSFLDCEWYSCGGKVETTFIQDLMHIITKLRNRLLKSSRIFPIGTKVISSTHLKYLIDHVSKDKHSLVRSDIDPKDRQNFLSAEKICSVKDIQCLIDHVPGSEGTVLYLRAMNNVLNAYLNVNLESTDRIYIMWCSVFFFRAWRSWLLNSEKTKTTAKGNPKGYYNLSDNFISSNCYTCIELNAHALVKKILIDENRTETEFFIPNLYGSQPCESTFRQIRSLSSTFSTVVNCNMLDTIHRMKNIQLQNDIINNSKDKIMFPRFQKKQTSTSIRSSNQDCHRFEGLNHDIIISLIEKARETVISELTKLEIDTSKLNFCCQVKPVSEEEITEDCNLSSDFDCELDSDCEDMEFLNELDEIDDVYSGPEEEIQEDINTLTGITGDLILKDYGGHNYESIIHLDEKSPFVVVVDNSGIEMVVRKSSVCWLLSTDKFKLSSDRLQRVQEKEYTNTSGNNANVNADDFVKNNEVFIGEWCIFSENSSEDEDDEFVKVMIGMVLGFSYTDGKTFKDREYSKLSAPVTSDANKCIGMLCTTYTYNASGELISVPGDKHRYINVESYIGTIKKPTYHNNVLSVSDKVLTELRNIEL